MRLLLTRAVEDSARTKARLEAFGHSVLVSPVIAFRPMFVFWPRRPPTGVIATSARAFAAYEVDGPSPEVRRTVPLFLVGQRTEEAARRYGFEGPATVAPDSATLAAILAPLKHTRFVYLTAYDRKDLLEDRLGAAGHRLIVFESYAADAADALTPDALAALAAGAIDAVLHYSRRSAAIFLALSKAAEIDPIAIKHLCLSADVAEPLQASGCATHVAESPDEPALLALLADC